MNLFDSHAHYNDEQFNSDGEEILALLPLSGITRVLIPGSDVESSQSAIALAEKFPYVYAAAGIHPHECGKTAESDMEKLHKLLSHPKVCALGEIGLDYFYDFAKRDLQKKWLELQLDIAEKLKKPVIIHDRDAHEDILKAVKSKNVHGVFHCFTGSAEMATELVRMGWYISFSGSVTFKNAVKLSEAVKAVPIDKILCETDSPYLSPVPYRGKRNDSRNMIKTVEKLAEIKQLPLDEMAKATYENACRLYSVI